MLKKKDKGGEGENRQGQGSDFGDIPQYMKEVYQEAGREEYG